MHDQLPKTTPDRDYEEFPIDDARRTVYVRRSNGDVERGWMVTGTSVKNGVEYSRVGRQTDAGFLEKDIPTDEMNRFHNETTQQHIGTQFANLALSAVRVSGVQEFRAPQGEGQERPLAVTDRDYEEFPIDDARRVVFVKRSNGEIEGNWIVSGTQVKNGVEISRVIKIENGQVISKDIPSDELFAFDSETRQQRGVA